MAAGLLAACSPAAQPPPAAAPPAPAQPQPTAAPAATQAPVATRAPAVQAQATSPAAQPAAGEPKRGGVLTMAIESDWVDLEPHKNSLFASMQAYDHVYESLTQYDRTLTAVPALAESWESPDPQTYMFKLRQGVKFHDGTPLTAEDVVYSFKRVLDPETSAPFRASLDSIDQMEIIDPHTLRITHKRPNVFFAETLASLRGTAIVKQGAGETGNLARQAIGTGPFKVAEIQAADFIRYERNPDYWNAPLPYLDGLILKLMVEEDTRVAWIRSGHVHYSLIYGEGAQRLENNPEVVVHRHPQVFLTGIALNVRDKPFSDGRVRRALDMALDRQAGIEKARAGQAALSGFIPTGFGEWYTPDDKLPAYYSKPDIDGAKKLLAEAGFQDGFKTTIKGSRPEHIAVALVAQDSWAKIGVDVEVVQLEFGTYIADYNAKKFETLVVGNTFKPDPNDFLWPSFHTNGPANRFGYSNPTLDEKLDRARTTIDRAALRQLFNEIEQDLWADGAPYLYLYNALNLEAVRSNIKGYYPQATARRFPMRETWME